MDYWERESALNEKKLKVSRVRLDYCINIYKQEVERRETSEKKSQFYLSFITILLGSVFLRLETLEEIKLLLDPNLFSLINLRLLITSVIGLGISIFAALVGIFQSMKVENYVGPVKENMTYEMFGPNSNHKDEIKIIDEIARIYSMAAEVSQRISNKKAMWVKFTSLSLFSTVLFLTVLLGKVAYLSLNT